jgi:uncharacterized membrane protein
MGAPWLLRFIENNTRVVESVIDVFHRPVARFMQRHPAIRTLLDGTLIGHPLHPAIIPIPIGAWSMGLVLDIATLFGQNRACVTMADLSYAVGLAGAAAALITGLAEWSYLEGNARRVTFVHAGSNILASALIATSLILRTVGFRGTGILVSIMALGAVGFGGWLGGELSYHYGAGVGRISSDKPQ